MECATLDAQVSSVETARSTRYFHGASTESAGVGILQDGVVRVPTAEEHDKRYGNSHQRPVANRVYLTSSLQYACVYALGGYVMGTRILRDAEVNPTGYVCVLDAARLPLIPDEDSLGQLPWLLESSEWASSQSLGSFLGLARAINADRVLRYRLERAVELLPAHTRSKAESGLAVWQSKAGKMLLRSMSPGLIQQIQPYFPHASVAENVPCMEVWAIAKADGHLVRPDSSNFFDVARRLS